MQTMPTDRVDRPRDLPRDLFGPAVVRTTPTDRAAALQRMARDEQFLGMLRGFRCSGGLARGHDVAALLDGRSGLNVGALARWIFEGEVLHFDWQSDTWFPMFQFSSPDMAPRAGVSRVLKELRGVFDPWDIAQWFACPSASLGDRTPAEAMELDPDLVLHVARYDRYVVDA